MPDDNTSQSNLIAVALKARVRFLLGSEGDNLALGYLGLDNLALDDLVLDDKAPAMVSDRGHAFYQTSAIRGLGPALRWAVARKAARLDLIVEADAAADVARRAELLDATAVGIELRVWSASGPQVEPAVAAPLVLAPTLPESHLAFRAVIEAAGARPVDDHGMLVAEVAGLEVARVVEPWAMETNPELEAAAADGGFAIPEAEKIGPQLSVGVGQADRELQEYVHGHLDDETNLRRAAEAVLEHRNPDSITHPLSRLAQQRWIRSVLLDDPSLVGLDRLESLPPLRPRETLLGTEPCAAVGAGPNGPAVVVCSVGVDLDLLPEAAEYRSRFLINSADTGSAATELVLVVPERDRLLAVEALAPTVPNLRVEVAQPPWESSGWGSQ